QNLPTSSLGQFQFRHLAGGTYYVAIVSAAISPIFAIAGPQRSRETAETDLTYPVTYYGDTGDPQGASPIVLTEGSSVQIQVTMRPAPNIHVPIPGNRSGSGTWSPQLFVRGPGGVRIGVSTAVTSAVDNTAWLSGIAAGHYLAQLQFVPPGRTSGAIFEEVDLADGVPLALPNRASMIKVSGQVVFEGGANPSNPFQIVLFDHTDGYGIPGQVGSDGAVTFTDSTFSPGLYSVQLARPDFYLRSISVRGARKVGDRIELLEGSSAAITITAAPAGNLCKLDGFAFRDGKPVAGAMVLLIPKDLDSTALFRRDQSDSDGSFTMAAIPAGRYTLVGIDDDGRGLVYKDRAVIEPYLAEGQTIEVPLRSKEPVKVAVRPRIQ
ncbi:MAG: intradiol ring-cleavage dioxygenase, partial [Bryobacterales bacterium]|nr:intradiol ring-cleavage dioxygenase [Bryobacterales bacterium]